ncbi:MAG: MarR family winged helix-turn-helix transcriptional regulator [Solirubrobacterales bacterium]
MTEMNNQDYETLLRFRTTLRHFLHWSEQQAREAGLTPAQHQLLLAIKGHPAPAAPTVGEVAEYLALQHHSAVELIDRAQKAGLVERSQDEGDHRIVHLRLSPVGDKRIARLSKLHLEELRRLGPFVAGP